MTDLGSPEPSSLRRRPALRLGVDVACWLGGLLLALAIRLGFSPTWEELRAVLLFAPLLFVLQALIGDFAGVYRRREPDSADELAGLAGSVLLATAAATTLNALLEQQPVPHSVPLAGGVLALLGMVTTRSLLRVLTGDRGASG